MRTILKHLLSLLAAALFFTIAVATSKPDKEETKITSEELDDKWCLTVDYGYFYCKQDNRFLVEAPDGTVYAINSAARADTTLPKVEAILMEGHTYRCLMPLDPCPKWSVQHHLFRLVIIEIIVLDV